MAFQFVYDDRKQVLENAAIKTWRFVPAYFTGNVWSLIDSHKLANYYRPVFLLWLKINYSLFGLSPQGWHAMSVVLNALVTIQVFWLARRLLRSEFPAAISALLFAVHPVHIESVAWVSGVTDPLAATFMLTSTLFFVHSLSKAKTIFWPAYTASILASVFALLSKEVAVGLPLLLVLTAFSVQPSVDPVRIWKYASPLFGLVFAYFLCRQFALHGFVHGSSHRTVDFILTLPTVILFYLRQFLVPFWIGPYADVYWVGTPNVQQFWIPLALCSVVLVAAVIGYRICVNRSTTRTVYAWSLLPLLPALYIPAFSNSELVHDRYLYVPSIGLSILAVEIGRNIIGRIPARPARIAVAAVLGGLAVLTFRGELDWASDFLLFKHAVQVAPHNDGALMNLGVVYIEANNIEKGVAALKLALEQNPTSALAAYDLAHYFLVSNDYVKAERMFVRALSLEPYQEDWQSQFAEVELRLGKIQQAERAVREAIRIRSDGLGFNATLGAVLLAKGDRIGAQTAFTEELRSHPENTVAREALDLLGGSHQHAHGGPGPAADKSTGHN